MLDEQYMKGRKFNGEYSLEAGKQVPERSVSSAIVSEWQPRMNHAADWQGVVDNSGEYGQTSP